MDWIATNAHQQHYIKRATHLPFVTCFVTVILVCICLIPIVSCHRTTTTTTLDIKNEKEKNSLTEELYNTDILDDLHNNNNNNDNVHLKKYKRTKTIDDNFIRPREDEEETHFGFVTNSNDNEKRISKKFRTKLHKRLRNKNRRNKNKFKQQNYDEYSQKLLLRTKGSENQVNDDDLSKSVAVTEKKYFDYFPFENLELNSNETNQNDDNIKVIILPIDDDKNNRKINKKQLRNKKWKKISSDIDSSLHYSNNRSKRSATTVTDQSITQIDSSIQKRNIISGRRRRAGAAAANIIRTNQNENNNDIGQGYGRYYSYQTINDPWNNRFIKPYNNFPLPMQSSSNSFIKYAIPGIYHNPISPPGNYKTTRPSSSTSSSSTDNPESIGNRFGEDRVVWDVIYSPQPTSPPRRTSTRRTQPPLIRDFSTTEAPRPVFSNTIRTQPPLIRDFGTTRGNNAQRPTVPSIPQRTQPPLIRNPTRERPDRTQGPTITRRPIQPVPTQPPRTLPPPTTTSKPELSKCVWAIISCCSRDNLTIRYNCFEQIGCHGAFWDYNPCADDIQDAALEKAEQYFD